MKNNQKAAKKPKISKKTLITIVVAVALLVAIGLGTFLTLDYLFVDTPYDMVHIPNHIRVAKYLGADISRSEIDNKVAESIDSLIDNFTKKNKITKGGKLEEGTNVTVAITAYLKTENGNEYVKDVSYVSYEVADIGNHEPEKDKEFFKALEKHLLDKVTKFDFESNYYNAAPNFTYTYPDDYSVTKVKGKEVVHEIIITAVTTSIVPEYNDKLFTDNKDEIISFLGINKEFNTTKEFEDYMRSEIELNVFWNSIVENSTILKYPEKFIEKYEDQFDAYYEAVMQSQGITRAQLLSNMGTDEAGYIKKRLEYAQGIVKEELILYEIVEAQKIRVSSEEYEEIGAILAAEGDYGTTVDEFEDALGKDVAERTILWEKVKMYILSKANWVA